MNMADNEPEARTTQDFQEFEGVTDWIYIVGHPLFQNDEKFTGTVARVLHGRHNPGTENAFDKRTRYVLELDKRIDAATTFHLNALKFGILHDFLEHEGLMGKPPEEINLAGSSSAYIQRAICDGGASTTLVGGGTWHCSNQARSSNSTLKKRSPALAME